MKAFTIIGFIISGIILQILPLKGKSEMEDADYQTWRLVLKRALSSPARTLNEFIANEEQYNENE